MVDTSALPMLLLYIVNKTIRTPGIVFFKIDATSIPFISGIDRSSKTRLGFRLLAFSIASNPLTASAQISRSGTSLRNSLITARTFALSSAIKIVFTEQLSRVLSVVVHGGFNVLSDKTQTRPRT